MLQLRLTWCGQQLHGRTVGQLFAYSSRCSNCWVPGATTINLHQPVSIHFADCLQWCHVRISGQACWAWQMLDLIPTVLSGAGWFLHRPLTWHDCQRLLSKTSYVQLPYQDPTSIKMCLSNFCRPKTTHWITLTCAFNIYHLFQLAEEVAMTTITYDHCNCSILQHFPIKVSRNGSNMAIGERRWSVESVGSNTH